jgi:hypothetical protein
MLKPAGFPGEPAAKAEPVINITARINSNFFIVS